MSTTPAPRPGTDLVPLTAAPTLFVVDEVQQMLAAHPELAQALADVQRAGRKNGLGSLEEILRRRRLFQVRTVEELGS